MPNIFPITREQRLALFKLFQRDFPDWRTPGTRAGELGTRHHFRKIVKVPTTQWRHFRKSVVPSFDCDGCIMIHRWGMWLCIERDGYTHS